MQERITCPFCSATLKCKPEWAGKKTRCPKCQSVFSVPPDPNDDGHSVDATANGGPQWFLIGGAIIISLVFGLAGGVIFGDQFGLAILGPVAPGLKQAGPHNEQVKIGKHGEAISGELRQ